MVDFFTAIKGHTAPTPVISKKVEPPSAVIKGNSSERLITNGKIKLFVYGTLKRNNIRHHVLTNAKYICEAFLDESLMLKQTGAFPGVAAPAEGFPVAFYKKELIPNNYIGKECIKGEIYETDYATMRKIDVMENVGSMYKKEVVPAYRLINGDPSIREMYRCFVYIGIPKYWENTALFPTPTRMHPVPHYIFNAFNDKK